jgi:hypothetical protein
MPSSTPHRHRRIPLRAVPVAAALALSSAGGCATRSAQQRPSLPDLPVLTPSRLYDDGAAVTLAAWVETRDTVALAGWRGLDVYRALAADLQPADAEQALAGIDRRLMQAALAPDGDPARQRVARALEHLAVVAQHARSGGGWRADNLDFYLPADRARVGRVLAGLFLPAPWTMTAAGDILVDAEAEVLNTPFAQLSHDALAALYASALSRALPPSPVGTSGTANAPKETAALEAIMLRGIQERGLVAYVTAQGYDLDAVPAAYRASLDRDQVADRFFQLEDVLRELGPDDGAAEVRTRYRAMLALDARDQTFAVIGAYVAGVIEAKQGHDALVDTMRRGPRAFWDAYVATRPGATVWMQLPTDAGEPHRPRRPAGSAPSTSH